MGRIILNEVTNSKLKMLTEDAQNPLPAGVLGLGVS